MKIRLISALTVFSVLGLCQQAKAYNLEACAKDPMTSAPQVINLLQPIDQKMIDCIPNLDSIASQWQSKANSIRSSINKVNIGNQGNTGIEKLEYNVAGGIISLVARVQAKHTWNVTIPEVRERVPVDKYRWVDVPYPDVRMERKCRLRVCVRVPVPFTNYRKEKVPYVEMEMRTITPARTVSGGGYSAELVRQIQQRLTTELGFLGTWASQTAVNLGVEQIVSMLTTGEVMNFGRFRVSVKAVNVPYVYQKCVVNRGDCTPELNSPRLGFAIIATPINYGTLR